SEYGRLFSISSIPSYALLGRSRAVIDMSAPKPGADSLKVSIQDALSIP
ncbi:MAG: TlpA family protein disulfide reductase, partial [Phaeodactylibacter sp.]|nr:TlpA family protein disulfide reductase [Phaeodactylibacter sp.]